MFQFNTNIIIKPRDMKKLLLVMLLAMSGFSAGAKELSTIDMMNEWGIDPVHLRVTADGYMIEFRYTIFDAQKALVLSDRKYFPHLLALKSKAKLSVPYFPTVGFVKSNRRFVKEGRNYIALFSNEGRHLLPGDQVKIQIRDKVSPVLTLQ